MAEITEIVSINRLSDEDKVFLLQSLAELCALYQAYLRGDFPEFTEITFQTKVNETQFRVEEIFDGLEIEGGCSLLLV